MMINDYYTRVPNEFIKGDDYKLTAKELTVMTILLQNINMKNICTFNMKCLYRELGIADNNSYSQKEIKNIINGFIQEEIIVCRDYLYEDSNLITDVSKLSKNDLIYAQLDSNFNDEAFTIITDNEIKKIKDYCNENSIDTYGLLATCLYILSCINMNKNDEDYLLCYPSIEHIAEEIDLSQKTVLKYINILNELKILVFDYAGYRVLADNKIKNGKMFYTRYENEELLLERLKAEREFHGFIKISKRLKEKSNLKKSIKQKINKLLQKDELSILEKERLLKLEETYKMLNTSDNNQSN